MGFKSIDQPGWLSEVERNSQMSIFIFWVKRGGRWDLSPSTSPANHQKLNVIQKWAFHFSGLRAVMDEVRVHQPAQATSKVECNPNMSISFFWLERGSRWVSSPLNSEADYQKFNVIEKWAFHFFGWREVADGVRVHRPTWLIIRSWT